MHFFFAAETINIRLSNIHIQYSVELVMKVGVLGCYVLWTCTGWAQSSSTKFKICENV